MNNIVVRNALYFLCCAIILCSCCNREHLSEYDNLPHNGTKEIIIDRIEVDTIKIDGSRTSLMGKWSLNNDKLYFLDYNVVGIKEFNLDGNYISTHIRKGNASNEWISPFVDFCFDHENNLTLIDRNWIINQFDTMYTKRTTPYIYLSDINYKEQQWNDLLKNPDVDDFHMYTYNLDSRKMVIVDDKLLIPVVTEHIDYNGYNIANAKEFWAESYNFMLINLKTKSTETIFGTYPPIYSRSNIPLFSNYSFDRLRSDDIIVSYAADSLIYVRNKQGVLSHSYGFDSGIIESEYTQTKSFDEYTAKLKNERQQKSYFTYILAIEDYVVRGYKRKGKSGYGFQIYKDENLIGEIDTEEEITIIGSFDNYLYGILPTDIENNNFRIAKISIN